MDWAIIDAVLGSASGAAADLSESALLRRYPAVVTSLALLFLAGVVADVYLLSHWSVRRSENQSSQRVPAPAWGLRAVLLGIGLLVGVSLPLALLISKFSLPSLLLVEMLTRALFLVGLLWFLQRRTNWQRALGVRQQPARAVWTGGLFYLAAIPPLLLTFLLYEQLLRWLGVPLSQQPIVELFSTGSVPTLVLLVGFAVLVAPVFEEVAFRGFVYPALKTHLGTWGALLMVSVLFTGLHGHLPSAGPLFALSLALGLSYEWSGSIWAPITLHGLFNATNVATLLYVRTQS